MHSNSNMWSLVLAGGSGTRLRSLTTTDSGVAVPKQYCSLCGGMPLIQETIQRALHFSSPDNICAVVVQEHQRWWQHGLPFVSERNLIVQPTNKGTATGILLPLLHILERDPNAGVVILPSDHYFADNTAAIEAIQTGIDALETSSDEVLLLGFEPEEIDAELGYIVPIEANDLSPLRVAHFVEKPSDSTARQLIKEGALWNSLILIAKASSLLNLFMEKDLVVVREMRKALAKQENDSNALNDLYRRLADWDFSRHILQGLERYLRVEPIKHCGWSDLGTPRRVEKVLLTINRANKRHVEVGNSLNLAAKLEQKSRYVNTERVMAIG